MTTTTKPASRLQTVDIIKGIAITLVVLGHTAQGMMHRNWWTSPSAYYFEAFIYSFHMPAFFFVSGLFVKSSIAKRGSAEFLIDKFKVVLYPYIVWCILGRLISPLLDRWKVATTLSWAGTLDAMLHHDYNWFLLTLFLCLVLALLTYRVPDTIRLIAALSLALLVPHMDLTPVDRPLAEFPFLAAGMWVSGNIRNIESIGRVRAAAGSLVLFLLGFYFAMHPLTPSAVHSFYLGILGTFGLVLFSRLLEGTPVATAFVWVGQASLGIYLLSAYGQGFGRLITQKALGTPVIPQLLLPSLVAILIPAIIWHLEDRIPPIGWLFHWPTRKPSR